MPKRYRVRTWTLDDDHEWPTDWECNDCGGGDDECPCQQLSVYDAYIIGSIQVTIFLTADTQDEAVAILEAHGVFESSPFQANYSEVPA